MLSVAAAQQVQSVYCSILVYNFICIFELLCLNGFLQIMPHSFSGMEVKTLNLPFLKNILLLIFLV